MQPGKSYRDAKIGAQGTFDLLIEARQLTTCLKCFVWLLRLSAPRDLANCGVLSELRPFGCCIYFRGNVGTNMGPSL